eukprot:scaffold38641_cov17-Tisochrysis_lutea.AAC.2
MCIVRGRCCLTTKPIQLRKHGHCERRMLLDNEAAQIRKHGHCERRTLLDNETAHHPCCHKHYNARDVCLGICNKLPRFLTWKACRTTSYNKAGFVQTTH